MREPLGGLEYVRAHLEEALATDARITQGGLHVTVDQDELVVTGSVPTAARRAAVSTVASDVAGEFRVRNETVVVPLGEPDTAEPVE